MQKISETSDGTSGCISYKIKPNNENDSVTAL